MRLGALVLQTQPWAEAAKTWRAVEAAGADTAYVADHVTHPTLAGQWWADPWTTLAAAAAVTDRIGLGTLVASAAIRTPAVLARAAATLQDISRGLFVLGLGAGVPVDVVADRGSADPCAESAADRFARYRDVVLGLRALWAGEPGRVAERLTFSGVEPLPHAPGREAPESAAMTVACERVGRDPSSLLRSVLVGYAGYSTRRDPEAVVAAWGSARWR